MESPALSATAMILVTLPRLGFAHADAPFFRSGEASIDESFF